MRDMNAVAEPLSAWTQVRFRHRVVAAASLVSGSIGLLGWFGWISEHPLLTSFWPGHIPIAPSTAVGFCLLAIAGLAWIARAAHPGGYRLLSLAAGTLVAAGACMELIEHQLGRPLGLDELFVRGAGTLGAVRIGHMSPITAAHFLLASTAVLSLAYAGRSRRAKQLTGMLATAVVVGASTLIFSYVYGSPLLYGSVIIPVALPTALALLSFGVALVVAAGPAVFPLRPFIGASTSARLLRVFFPLAVVTVPVYEVVEQLIEQQVDVPLALLTAVSAMLCCAITGPITWYAARRIGNALDEAYAHISEQARLLDAAHDAIVVKDDQHRVTYWNCGAERLYGWEAKEAVGRRATELLCDAGADEPCMPPQDADASPDWTGQLHQRTKDGRRITVMCRRTAIPAARGKRRRYLMINSDITEQQQLEQDLLRSQRLQGLGALASGIAHDLNNILQPILMAVPALEQRLQDMQSRWIVRTVEESADRGRRLIKHVLLFAKGAQGHKVAVPLRHLIADMTVMLQASLPKTIEIVSRFPKELWDIHADPTQVEQMLLNLCLNSRDAMPRGGTLTLEAENVSLTAEQAGASHPAGLYVAMKVRDTGEGMPPEVQKMMYEPFFTTKAPGQGTGLGLATVDRVVKLHGGFIQCTSAVGRGTQFSVYLLAVVPDAAAASASVSTELPRGRGQLVLMVDDEASIREMTKATLGTFGYTVLLASQGAEAVARFAEQQALVAAVIVDMNMPVMDGAATIRALRTIREDARIIAASGTSEGEHATAARALGVPIFLTKPFTAEALLSALRDVLAVRPAAA